MPALDRGDGVRLAYEVTAGSGPAIVFLPGFMSDMTGDKALAVERLCRARGWPSLRLDYSGHGASGGAFEDGTIGSWTRDALCLIDAVIQGQIILVGSSMGGWIALNLALARPDRVAGLIGIAAAPDFTETLIWEAMLPQEREALARDGIMRVPSQYGGEQVITRTLIEEGRQHLLLRNRIPIRCPVRLLHGMQDPDVPWEVALKLAERLESADVRVTLVKDAGHRLSRPQDIALLTATVTALAGEAGG